MGTSVRAVRGHAGRSVRPWDSRYHPGRPSPAHTGRVIETTGRGDLAGLLRAWRDRLQPEAVGFPVGQRRTRGLRREEVALLAGLSVDYLVRLEQGRAARPSAQVVASLARVLQLSDPERDELYAAAGLAAPTSGPRAHAHPGQRAAAARPAPRRRDRRLHRDLDAADRERGLVGAARRDRPRPQPRRPAVHAVRRHGPAAGRRRDALPVRAGVRPPARADPLPPGPGGPGAGRAAAGRQRDVPRAVGRRDDRGAPLGAEDVRAPGRRAHHARLRRLHRRRHRPADRRLHRRPGQRGRLPLRPAAHPRRDVQDPSWPGAEPPACVPVQDGRPAEARREGTV